MTHWATHSMPEGYQISDWASSPPIRSHIPIFATPHMQRPRDPLRLLTPPYPIARIRQKSQTPTKGRRASYPLHLPDRTTHTTVPNPPSHRPSHHPQSSPSDSRPLYSNRILVSTLFASARRAHSSKAGPLTRAMPSGRKGVSREVEVSKSLSYLLRHAAKTEGIQLDEGGWVNVADVLQWRRIASLKVDLAELRSVVATNDKKRYQIEPDPSGPLRAPSASEAENWRIRATQGHSITTVSSEHIFKPILLADADCPDYVVHGTDRKPWRDIERDGGLKPMRRKHIHFATRLPDKLGPLDLDFQSRSRPKEQAVDKVISGMRDTSTIAIWVDVKKSLEDGVKWWRSENDVVLTEGVGEPKMLGFEWIKWVEVRGKGKILYGEKVETANVREMEMRMDQLGVGKGGREGEGEGVGVSHDKAPAEKTPREKVGGAKVLQEEEANGKEKLETAAAVKDNWDD